MYESVISIACIHAPHYKLFIEPQTSVALLQSCAFAHVEPGFLCNKHYPIEVDEFSDLIATHIFENFVFFDAHRVAVTQFSLELDVRAPQRVPKHLVHPRRCLVIYNGNPRTVDVLVVVGRDNAIGLCIDADLELAVRLRIDTAGCERVAGKGH